MVIEDHINMIGNSPLIGPNLDVFGPRFPDMTEVYNKKLRVLCHDISKRIGIDIEKGVYCAISGPNYNTKAELKMLIAVVAKHSGIKVLGLSCVTDMAIPDNLVPLTHEEVIRIAGIAEPKFVNLVRNFIKEVELDESL